MNKIKLSNRFIKVWKKTDKNFNKLDEIHKAYIINDFINNYKSLRNDTDSGCSEKEDFETASQMTLESVSELIEECNHETI